ncbi:MAG: glycine betaine ABC transporter substrate-binding protein [candidate division NC10 bacterium]|jgi:osmoprotectant transport system permease protein
MRALIIVLMTFILVVGAADPAGGQTVVVGSKHFNEGYILAEIIARLLEDRGFPVERKFGLGGTLICFGALKNGEIDIYPEYSGTLAQAILKLPGRVSYAELRGTVKRRFGMDLLDSFGFDNTYAIALRRNLARQRGLKTISDLARFPDLRFGFSYEFLNRHDGWPGLARTYGLSARPVGIEHGLAYQAIHEKELDVTDVYSTDGDIKKFDLFLLEDDREYFSQYLAAPLVRGELDGRIKRILGELAGTIADEKMQALNAMVILEGKSFADVAHRFLREARLLKAERQLVEESKWVTLLFRTATHLKLTFIALLAGMVVAIPMGIWVYRVRAISRPVMYIAGLLQTIPSIALLAFMIPLFGIGAKPAIMALFLYSLLPILRNTATALFSIDPVLKKVSVGMGLTAQQRLRYIELPLAAPTILAGIRTAAVINIGTATLAAFIGAGGLGEPIVTGLALNDTSLILEGAIPAALLAIMTEWAFEGLEKLLVPKHLLQAAVE